jgi:hypothetical protein
MADRAIVENDGGNVLIESQLRLVSRFLRMRPGRARTRK